MNDGTLVFVNFAVYSWLLLVPVVAIEAWEFRKGLGISVGRAAAVSSVANLGSTVLVTLFVLAVGTAFGYFEFIAQPQAGEGDIAVLIALVPCFFISVWVDSAIGAAMLKQIPKLQLRTAFVRANQLAYAMIAIVPIARFLKSAIYHGRIIW